MYFVESARREIEANIYRHWRYEYERSLLELEAGNEEEGDAEEVDEGA